MSLKTKERKARKLKEDRAPKLQENTKHALFIRGHKTSNVVNMLLTDFYSLKKPYSTQYSRKSSNGTKGPFEDPTSIEFFSMKNDASLFMHGTHIKKRPHNLIIGRMFHFHVMDMVEFGISGYKSIEEFNASKLPGLGTKSAIILIGSLFQTDEKYKLIGNLFIDFFRGPVVKQINLPGLDKVMTISVCEGTNTISFRHYSIQLKKSGTRVPRVELEEIGPSVDLEVRRTRFGDGVRKEAIMEPKQGVPKKKKT